jgi:hypothetical protein
VNARIPDDPPREQAARYYVELFLMGWPLEVPHAPPPMHHALQVVVALLAARCARDAA